MFLILDKPAPVTPNICCVVSTGACGCRSVGDEERISRKASYGKDDSIRNQGFEGDGHRGGIADVTAK